LRRQEAVASLVEATQLRLRVAEALHGIGDIDRLVSRVQQGAATPRELVALARTLGRLAGMRQALSGILPAQASVPAQLDLTGDSLAVCAALLDGCDDICATIKSAFVEEPPISFSDGGFVRAGYAEAIDAIDLASKDARDWLAGLETAERARTGIKSLKVVYSRVFGYAIEVSKSNLAQVPAEYIRRQTVAGGERYVTPELKQREAQILHAQEQRVRLELDVLQAMRELVAGRADAMLRSADAVAQIDVYAAFAAVALERGYCRPLLDEADRIVIEAGRHPVVEVTQQDVAFVPNDTVLDDQRRLLVLTGPNMAGKSTYLRQVALIVLLAQVGSFVPAAAARIGLVDRIFTRVGAQDDLAAGQSTFMVEMVETSAILAECTPRSLVILDEIGRGTSTYDGLAIAQAVLEYIHDDLGHRAKTIFATHYHELTVLADTRPHVANLRMDVIEEGGRVIFLRRVVAGGADRSYGIHVAELAGLPERVIKRARGLLRQLEAGAPGARSIRRKMREAGSELQLPLFSQLRNDDASGIEDSQGVS
jgi:DNA mismatch repair protein MutS